MGNRKENIKDDNNVSVAVVESHAVLEETAEHAEISIENDTVTKEPAKQEAPAVHGIEPKNDKVIVCLKHPQGIKFNLPNNRYVIIKGNAAHLKGLKSGILPDGGFGMTVIDRQDWEYIKKTYSTMNVFKNGLIFASNNKTSAESQSKEHDEVKSGMEPVEVGENTSIKDLQKVNNYIKDK